ncbi:MAG: class IV adenylate cyclase [Acidobacteriota bacterium]
MNEIEVKIRVDDPARWQPAFEEHFELVAARHFEDNFLLDWPDKRIGAGGCTLRVRILEGRGLLTFKGPVVPGLAVKSRPESEVEVSDGAALIEIFESLGLRSQFRYQKYRTVYRRGECLVVVDDTPIGMFFEIEGEVGEIRNLTALLGFSEEQWLRDSYRELYQTEARRSGSPARDMISA